MGICIYSCIYYMHTYIIYMHIWIQTCRIRNICIYDIQYFYTVRINACMYTSLCTHHIIFVASEAYRMYIILRCTYRLMSCIHITRNTYAVICLPLVHTYYIRIVYVHKYMYIYIYIYVTEGSRHF